MTHFHSLQASPRGSHSSCVNSVLHQAKVYQTIPIFQPLARSLPFFPLKTSGFWKHLIVSYREVPQAVWVELEALLSQNVSFPPRAATPGTLQTLPGWEREVSLFAFQAFQLAGKKKNKQQ